MVPWALVSTCTFRKYMHKEVLVSQSGEHEKKVLHVTDDTRFETSLRTVSTNLSKPSARPGIMASVAAAAHLGAILLGACEVADGGHDDEAVPLDTGDAAEAGLCTAEHCR